MRGNVRFGAAALALVTVLIAAQARAATMTWQLNNWETGTEGWNGAGGDTVSQTPEGATSGLSSMKISAPTGGFQWGANTEYNIANLDPANQVKVQAFNHAGSGNESNSWFEYDVTWLASENDPANWAGLMMSVNSANGWSQSPDNLVQRVWGTNGYDVPVQTFHVVTPAIGTWSGLGTNKLPNGNGEWFQIHFGFNPTGTTPSAVHIDNLQLVTPPVPEPSALALAALGASAGLLRRRRA
jgi:hypothetical protein